MSRIVHRLILFATYHTLYSAFNGLNKYICTFYEVAVAVVVIVVQVVVNQIVKENNRMHDVVLLYDNRAPSPILRY